MNNSRMNAQKKRSLLLGAIVVCSVLLVALIVIAVVMHFESQEGTKPGQDSLSQTGTVETAPTETTGTANTVPQETEAPEKTLEVVTDYGTFLLSGHWTGEMRTQIINDGVYTIRAYGQIGSQQEQHLFDVCFGGSNGDSVGYIVDGNGQLLEVNIVLSDFAPDESWAETETLEFYGMQDEVNSIIGQLELVTEDLENYENTAASRQVETPYLTLSYPERWGEQIRTEVSGEDTVTVSFYGTPSGVEECHLFDIILAGSGENAVGIYTTADGTEITVEAANFSEGPDESWDEQAALEMYAMLDIINDILLALEQSGSFAYI